MTYSEFEVIVVERQAEDVTAALAETMPEIAHGILPMDGRFTCVRLAGPREAPGEPAGSVARLLSTVFERCLVAVADDRAGVRAARLFREGALVEEFGAEDEVWVPRRADGMPDSRGPLLRCFQVVESDDPELDFDCLFDGIDAGLLFVTGSREWSSSRLRRFLANA